MPGNRRGTIARGQAAVKALLSEDGVCPPNVEHGILLPNRRPLSVGTPPDRNIGKRFQRAGSNRVTHCKTGIRIIFRLLSRGAPRRRTGWTPEAPGLYQLHGKVNDSAKDRCI